MAKMTGLGKGLDALFGAVPQEEQMAENDVLKNLKINGDSRFQGLFGFNGGTINGIIIESGTINNTKALVGAICGQNNGNIINCINKADIFVKADGNGSLTGGICGFNSANAVIENCRNTGYIMVKTSLLEEYVVIVLEK